MPVNPRKLVELAREFPKSTGEELIALAEKAHEESLQKFEDVRLCLYNQFKTHGFYMKKDFGEISIYHFSDIKHDKENKSLTALIEIITFDEDNTENPFEIRHNIWGENLDDFDVSKLIKIQPITFFNLKQNLLNFKKFITSQNYEQIN